MPKIGLFYGTETGSTEGAAKAIQQEFGGDRWVTLHHIYSMEPQDFDAYPFVVIGCPTWSIGELSSDWMASYDELDNVNFQGKKVAYFGLGDQLGYEDNFVDAIGILEAKISSLGGITVGDWPTDGYDFRQSKAVRNGKFVGLALDAQNQPDLTEGRIKLWVAQLQQAFDLNSL
jgi:flavodoxin I